MSQLLVFRVDPLDQVPIHGSGGAGTRRVYTGGGFNVFNY